VATGIEETLPAIREYKINTPFFFGQSMYSDVDPNNASWLLSNDQWNSKSVYPDYYDWLLKQYNNPTESNVIKVGSIVDDNGVLSGFSATNNVLLPVTFSSENNPWEIVIKFKTPQTFSEQGLISKTHQNGMNYGLRIAVTKEGWMYYLIGSSYNTFICEGLGVQTLSADTNYYVKFEFTGEAYKAYISTDAETWTEDFSFSTTTPIESFNEPTYLGDNRYKNIPFTGSIDLNESYININGQRWWNGRKAMVIKTGETSVSIDYDYIINISDETFRLPLKTRLASGSAVVGNGMTLGATDGTNNQGLTYQTNGVSYGVNNYGKPVGSSEGGGAVVSGKTIGITSDPSKSGIETSSNGLKLYFYVGDVVQDASLINAGAALSQLSDKISRSKVSDKELVVSWSMPDYTAGVNMGAGITHTATRKGWVMFKTSTAPGYGVIQINGIEFSKSSSGTYGTAFDTVQEFIPVDIGDTFFITNNATAVCIFYPCKGVN
jgi:hypothetical protein